MRAFNCDRCGQLVFFENSKCLRCGAALGFDHQAGELITFAPTDAPVRCANSGLAGCNWLVAAEGELCRSCALTRTRPADEDLAGLAAFRAAEAAKRHLLFELGDLVLPVESFREREGGLAFDLLSSESEPVTTGHAAGVITLDLAESDDAQRARRRKELGEPYRTVLGHVRHEIGHYYFPILAPGGERLDRCRELFGDERADYSAALERHYAEGPPEDWRRRHVSAYATMHPSEDWAESFAHYLHIRDSLQTATAYGVSVRGPDAVGALSANPDRTGPDAGGDFERIVAEWLPLTYALNAINRSMGRGDLYPFVLSDPVIAKLALVDELVRA